MGASAKLHLREPFDERTAWEVSSKGWYTAPPSNCPTDRVIRSSSTILFAPPKTYKQRSAWIDRAWQSRLWLSSRRSPKPLCVRRSSSYMSRVGWFEHLRRAGEAV
jgi:hypothetical protein